ncbi:MAG: hypothetical protein JW982_01910 [Spirochaetes bacterium]|nr:hypothetical protein [Spirochaetota bacterium]
MFNRYLLKIMLAVCLMSVQSCVTPGKHISNADNENFNDIIPGHGIGKLRIGMSMEDVLLIFGNPTNKIWYDLAYNEYVESGYDPEQMILFYQGFDTELTFDNDISGIDYPYPVYVMYFSNNRLVYFVLTSYCYPDDKFMNLKVKGKVIYMETTKNIIEWYGSDYVIIHTNDYDEYVYPERGISIISDEGIVRCIDIFKPLDSAGSLEYISAVKN